MNKRDFSLLGLVAVIIIIIAITFMDDKNDIESNSIQDAGSKIIKYGSGLQAEIIEEGTGDEKTKNGDMVVVHYTGTLENGSKFDSSLDRGEPFSFKLGAGQVIKGWDEGLVGMKIGEKRRLAIPSELGYGKGGFPPVIPLNSNLIFEVELIDIK